MKNIWIKILMFAVMLVCVGAFGVSLMFGSDEVSQNSFYGHFVVSGGPIVWFVLVPMSLVMVYLCIDLGLSIRRKNIVPEGIVGETATLIKNHPDQRWLIYVNRNEDFVSNAVIRVMNQTHTPSIEIDRLLIENIEQQALKVLRKIEWANIIGNVAPMVGLFGTVFGMIKAFNGIVVAGGQPQPAHLAEGISLALVTTFWGLLVAIPALAVAGIFKNRLEGLTSQAIAESEILVPLLRQSLRSEKDYIRKVANKRENVLAGETAGENDD